MALRSSNLPKSTNFVNAKGCAELWSSTSATTASTNASTVADFRTNLESWRKPGKVSLVNCFFFVGQRLPSCPRRGITIHKGGLETMTHALKCDHNCSQHIYSRSLAWHFITTGTQKLQCPPVRVLLYQPSLIIQIKQKDLQFIHWLNIWLCKSSPIRSCSVYYYRLKNRPGTKFLYHSPLCCNHA